MLHFAAHINIFFWLCGYLKRLTGGNRTHDRNTGVWLYNKFDATAFFGLMRNKPFFLEHGKMIINMTSAGNLHLVANLAIGWRHALSFHVGHNKIVHSALYVACLF